MRQRYYYSATLDPYKWEVAPTLSIQLIEGSHLYDKGSLTAQQVKKGLIQDLIAILTIKTLT